MGLLTINVRDITAGLFQLQLRVEGAKFPIKRRYMAVFSDYGEVSDGLYVSIENS
jgi:hypothetical protein